MRQRINLLLALAVVALGFAAGATATPTRSTAAIATVASSDFRAELVARPTSSGSAPTATAILTTYRRTGQTWLRILRTRVAGTYFWNTLAGPRSICRFELASAGRPHITVQLLESPALGCAHSQTIGLVR